MKKTVELDLCLTIYKLVCTLKNDFKQINYIKLYFLKIILKKI